MKRFLKYLLFVCVMVLIIADCLYVPEAQTLPEATVSASASTDPPPTETETPAEAGPFVTVDGDALESGSILLDGAVYVAEEEFVHALDREYEIPSGVACLYRDRLWIPLEQTCTELSISIFEDGEENRLYCTSGIQLRELPGNIRVPVLMYHAVDSEPWGHRELFVTPEVMEQHLQFLLDNGYDPIFFEDLPNLEQYDKPVILTFDDGYRNNYTELYPLLQKYQVKATIFIVTSSIGTKETSMTPEQVKELADSGLVSIQSHTVNHRVLKGLSEEEQRLEMEQSKLLVTRLTGREPFVVSYPTGVYDENTLALAQEFYRFGVIVLRGDYITGADPWTIRRYNVRDTTPMEDLALMVCDAGKPG